MTAEHLPAVERQIQRICRSIGAPANRRREVLYGDLEALLELRHDLRTAERFVNRTGRGGAR